MSRVVNERRKGDAIKINNEAELDKAIKDYAALERKIQANENAMNEEIDQIKAENVATEQKFRAEQETLYLIIQVYIKTNRLAVLKGNQSRQFNFGRVGFRKEKETIKDFPSVDSDEMAELVKKVRRNKDLIKLVKIHSRDWIKKGELNDLDNSMLAKLGLERKAGDEEFFLKPDHKKIEETEAHNDAA